MSFETPVSQLKLLSSRLEYVDDLLNDAVELLDRIQDCEDVPEPFKLQIDNMIKRMTYI